MKRKDRYQAAIFKGHSLLLLKVHDRASGQTFWVIPGGGRESSETEEECLQREVHEETGLRIEVGSLLLDETAFDDGLYERYKTYACHILEGTPQPGIEPELDTASHTTIREVGWFDMRDPTGWDPLALNDPITYPLLKRLRSIMGYFR